MLDTDILSILQARNPPHFTRVMERMRAAPPDTVFWTTIISFEEQLRGWLEYVKRGPIENLPRAYLKLSDLNRDFSTWPVLLFDDAAADTYARLRKEKVRIGTSDLRIAAIVISRNELLVSRNLRDFRKVPGLRVEDWSS